MSDLGFDNRLRSLEHRVVEVDVHKDVILQELKKVGASIDKGFTKFQGSLDDLDGRVRHIERIPGSLDGISLSHRELGRRLSKLEIDLTTHLAQEAMTSKGISWAAAILGGLIASGITGVVGAVVSRVL